VPDWERVDKSPSDLPKPPTAWPRGRRFLAGMAAVAFTLVTLVTMDRWTVDSVRATASDIPHLPEGVAEYAEFKNKDHVRGVLELIEAGDLYVPGASMVAELNALEARCRLILLAGIGTENVRRLEAVGIGSIDALAAAEAAPLLQALTALGEPGWKPHPRRVAGWIREARAARPAPALLEAAPEPASPEAAS
ncbi:MAG: DUF4332 domain-containing protein, partial [Gemmatimonadetes bacterium]|nr:DUF4332 domain-containing protein [Gemmatimonadota bacterium]